MRKAIRIAALGLVVSAFCPADGQIVFSAQVQVTAQNSFNAPTWGANSQLIYTYQFNKSWPDSLGPLTPFLIETVAVSDVAMSVSGTGFLVDSVSPGNDSNWTYSLNPPPPYLPAAEVMFSQLNVPASAGPPPFCYVSGPGADPSGLVGVNGADPGTEPTQMVARIYEAFHQAGLNNFGASTEDGFWEAPPPSGSGPWSVSRQYSMDYTGPDLPCNSGSCWKTLVHLSIRYFVSINVPQPTPQSTWDDDPCLEAGSIVGCRNQSLGQEIAVAGTPFSLRYQSDRQPGSVRPFSAWTFVPPPLGGWTLTVNHVWDADGKVLYLGDGGRRSGDSVQPVPTSDGGFLIPGAGENLIYQFDARNRHVATLDEFTRAAIYQFQYDSAGRLTSIQDAYGNVTRINRTGTDISSVPVSIVGPYGATTQLVTDFLGYLTQIIAPDGTVTSMSSDAGGLMQTLTDPNGNAHRFSYDLYGHLTLDNEPAGGFQTLARTDGSNGATVVRATSSGRVSTYQAAIDSSGNGTGQTTFPDGTSALEAKTGSLVNSLQDSAGTAYQFGWTPDSRWGTQDAAQDAVPGAIGLTSPAGIVARITLDHSTDLSTASDPLSLSATHELLQINGRPYRQEYSAALRTFTVTSPAGRIGTRTLDANGNTLQESYGGLASKQYAWDDRGRLSSVTWGQGADARNESFGYGTDGYIANFTDALGETVSMQRDKVGRLLQSTLPDGAMASFTYDGNGNLTAFQPPGRPAHTLAYTPLDEVSSYVPPAVPGTGTTAFTWNTDGEVTQIALPGGLNITASYDTAGHLTSRQFAGGGFTYAYDSKTGQVSSVTDADGNSVSHTYDGSLPLADTWAGAVSGTVARTFDSDFRVASIAAAGADPIAIGYDPDSYLANVGDLTITRHPDNALVTGTTLNTVVDARSYNAFGELTGYRASGPSGDLYSLDLTRDNLGRITDKTETIGGTTSAYRYSYDVRGRLAGVQRDGALLAQYSYDSNGNRLVSVTAAGTEAAVYDDQDRQTLRGTTSYTYSANGELIRKASPDTATQYEYDGLGNLRRVVLPDGPEIRYLIDGEGRRIAKQVNGTLVQSFLWDGMRPLAELDGAGNLISLFVYGGGFGAPAYMIRAGTEYRILSDPVGSPRLVVNSSTGQVVQQIDYDSFGVVLADTNPGIQPFGFAGGLYDAATGLVHFHEREYDPDAGRWTSKDPLNFEGGDMNLYAYLANDPMNRIDPYGLGGLQGDDASPVAPLNLAGAAGAAAAGSTPQSAVQAKEESWFQPAKWVDSGEKWFGEQFESASGAMGRAWDSVTEWKGDVIGKDIRSDPTGEYGKAHQNIEEGEKGAKDLKQRLRNVVDTVNNGLCDNNANNKNPNIRRPPPAKAKSEKPPVTGPPPAKRLNFSSNKSEW